MTIKSFEVQGDIQTQVVSSGEISNPLGVAITTDRGTLLLGNQPEIGAPQHFHIMKETAGAADLYFGDDYNYVLQPYTGGVEIKGDDITVTVANPPTTLIISGADFSAVNLTYNRSVGITPPTWVPAGYNPVTDPSIVFDGRWEINVPGFNQPIYVNTGNINHPLVQWDTNPPLGSVAPTGSYTFSDPVWTFNGDGSLTFPLQATNNRTGNAQALTFTKSGTQKSISTQGGTQSNPTVERLVIAGGDGYRNAGTGVYTPYSEGGDIYLWAGRGADGGDIKVDAGNSYGINGELGGDIKIRAGYSQTGNGGFVEIDAGQGGNANGGYVTINGGTGNINGGDITITAGSGGTLGGKVRLASTGGTHYWDFDAAGSLTLPVNNSNGVISVPASTNGYINQTCVNVLTGGANYLGNSSYATDYPNTTVYVPSGPVSLVNGNFIVQSTDVFNVGDVITIPVSIQGNTTATLQVVSLLPKKWQFGTDGKLTLPSSGTVSYSPTTPGDWNSPAPTTIQDALDRLAAVVKTLNGGTGA